mgnify:CR=1 FL=1
MLLAWLPVAFSPLCRSAGNSTGEARVGHGRRLRYVPIGAGVVSRDGCPIRCRPRHGRVSPNPSRALRHGGTVESTERNERGSRGRAGSSLFFWFHRAEHCSGHVNSKSCSPKPTGPKRSTGNGRVKTNGLHPDRFHRKPADLADNGNTDKVKTQHSVKAAFAVETQKKPSTEERAGEKLAACTGRAVAS